MVRVDRARTNRPFCRATLALGAVGAIIPAVTELRFKRAQRPLTDSWQHMPLQPRRSTLLGISFRPRQAEALGLDPHAALEQLLALPFDLVRLGAYWDHMETGPGTFDPSELDWQIEAAEAAHKQIIVCLGPVKTFGYPEYFVPRHHLAEPITEGSLVQPETHSSLLSAGEAFITRVVERYRHRQAIIAWQVEHEAVDPLGLEHSWRLSVPFVRREVDAVRTADPARPIMMNGFLPTSSPVRLQQWWRTRYQGDSLSVAPRLADIVGIDFYPCHGLVSVGRHTLYLDGSRLPWQQRRRRRLFRWAAAQPGRRVMIAEGQAEPWETVTTPPSPEDRGMFSCLPERLVDNYNQTMSWHGETSSGPWAYLFWGAEYWLLRQQQGDSRYLDAFTRVLTAT